MLRYIYSCDNQRDGTIFFFFLKESYFCYICAGFFFFFTIRIFFVWGLEVGGSGGTSSLMFAAHTKVAEFTQLSIIIIFFFLKTNSSKKKI